MNASTGDRLFRLSQAGISGLLVALVLAACVGPVEGGPPDMADVETHLGLTVGYLPTSCEPIGLDGDGRGTIVGAGFACPEEATLRIQHFDSDVNDDPLPGAPTETGPGRIEWRDGSTGDVIRVVSDGFDTDVLVRVAESIEIADGRS